MSASEKLRALEGFGPPSNYDEMYRLQDALPQIVAVVEAAEAFEMQQHLTITKDTIWTRLSSALAALDEALS